MLVELAVLDQVAVRTVAHVERLAVYAHAAIEARVGKTFVSVEPAAELQKLLRSSPERIRAKYG